MSCGRWTFCRLHPFFYLNTKQCLRIYPITALSRTLCSASVRQHRNRFYSNADHARRIRKGRDLKKSDACAQKTHSTHALGIQLLSLAKLQSLTVTTQICWRLWSDVALCSNYLISCEVSGNCNSEDHLKFASWENLGKLNIGKHHIK